MRMMITMMTWRGLRHQQELCQAHTILLQKFCKENTGLLLATGPPHFCELCTIASSIILPAENRTHQDLSKKKVVLQVGGGLRPPPPTQPPPLSCKPCRLAFKNSALQQELRQTNHTGILFAMRLCVYPHPRVFINCARLLQVSSCQQKQNTRTHQDP